MEQLNAYVGGRIRLYRQIKGYTLSKLASMIHKSKATVSKYENGEITLDILTLFEIAAALGICVEQLTDYQPPEQEPVKVQDAFFPQDTVCLYFYDGRSSRVVRSLLSLRRLDSGGTATLYNDLKDLSRPEECRNLYYGTASFFDTITNFALENQSNRMEQVTLCAANPFDRSDRVSGMLTGISRHPMLPVSIKCILSAVPLEEDQALKEALLLSKEDLRRIKHLNMFAVEQG